MQPEPPSIRRPGHARVAGHLGEFLQGILGENGPVALITLPCPVLTAQAWWWPGRGFAFMPGPGGPLSRPGAAALLRRRSGVASGRLYLHSALPPGGGAGASTAALIAVARAVDAGAARPGLSPTAMARLCIALEGASDPLMFPDPAAVVWASREGRVIETVAPPPSFDVVGGFLGAAERTDPRDRRFARIDDLLADWGRAVRRQDHETLAALATESARRQARYRGRPSLAPFERIATATGAVGIATAHTGSARALLYAPGRGNPEAGIGQLRALGARQVMRFRSRP
jgi:uncharacterized protein involved in propanediol utilization